MKEKTCSRHDRDHLSTTAREYAATDIQSPLSFFRATSILILSPIHGAYEKIICNDVAAKSADCNNTG